MSVWLSLFKVAVRVRPLNGTEVEDKNCTEIVHVLDENVSGYISLHSIFLWIQFAVWEDCSLQ